VVLVLMHTMVLVVTLIVRLVLLIWGELSKLTVRLVG
jgi:hypothetical protein